MCKKKAKKKRNDSCFLRLQEITNAMIKLNFMGKILFNLFLFPKSSKFEAQHRPKLKFKYRIKDE